MWPVAILLRPHITTMTEYKEIERNIKNSTISSMKLATEKKTETIATQIIVELKNTGSLHFQLLLSKEI